MIRKKVKKMTARVRAGSVIGRDHFLLAKNSQDSFVIRQIENEGSELLVGVIADGCGSARRSELGAHLVTSFLAEALVRGDEPEHLGSRFEFAAISLRDFLANMSSYWSKPAEFTREHLLATVIGFISDGKKVLIFSRGDGYVFLGETALMLDENNQPNYLAYDIGQRGWEHHFHLMEVDLDQIGQLAIATDGFEPEMISRFWGKNHPNGVQRELNNLWRKKHFADDATIIALELTKEG